jgi:protein O-mannosyl-transferase
MFSANKSIFQVMQLPMLLIVAAVTVAYMNSLGGPFLFDDYGVIVDYGPVHSLSGWVNDLTHGIRPLLKLTYLLNWISGTGAKGFHIVNICIHTGNSILIYILTSQLTEKWRVSSEESLWNSPAMLASLLFALHPVQTEAVSYVSGRSSSLMALFFLGSVVAYLYGKKSGSKFLSHILSPGLYLSALTTKETALILPFVLLLLESTRREDRWLAIFRRQCVHWGLFFAAIIAVVAHPRYARLLWISMDTRSLHDNLLSQINGVTYLLSRFAWIHRLNIDPDLPILRNWSPILLLQLSLMAAMVVMAVLARKKRPWIWFGIFWFFIALLPTNSVLPRFDIANERHLYLAGFGLYLIAGIEISRQVIPASVCGKSCVAALFLILAAFTINRNSAYQSNLAMWEATARLSPAKSRVFNNLGLSYELEGRRATALSMYEKAVRLDPANLIANNNLNRLRESQAASPERH